MARDATATKEQLMRAAERLFARRGIHQVRVREINALAGQRNASAVHYHFGSRQGLVQAILGRHQVHADQALGQVLDELEAQGRTGDIRALVGAQLGTWMGMLHSASGRNFLRIVPQVLDDVAASMRSGPQFPDPSRGPWRQNPNAARLLELEWKALQGVPEALRRERLVTGVFMLTTAMADRARLLDQRARVLLDDDAFRENLLDMCAAALTASPDGSTAPSGEPRARRPPGGPAAVHPGVR